MYREERGKGMEEKDKAEQSVFLKIRNIQKGNVFERKFNISRKMIWGQEQNINSEVFKGCVERWSIIIEILKGKAIDHYLTGGRFLSAAGNHDADNWCSK